MGSKPVAQDRLVSAFGKVYQRRKVKMNVRRSEVRRCSTSQGHEELLRMRLNGWIRTWRRESVQVPRICAYRRFEIEIEDRTG